MNLDFVAAAAAAGAVLGLGAGGLNVLLERVERLREENAQERAAALAEALGQAGEARARSLIRPSAPVERYGWTWLEWGAAPVLGAVCFGLFASREGLTWIAVELFLWLVVLVQIATFDLKHRLILDKVTYPAIALALLLSALTPGLSLPRAAIGAAVVGGFFFLFHVVSRGGMGLGDAKLGALMGAVMGLGFDSPAQFQVLYAVCGGVVLGGAVALLLLVTRVRSLRDAIPYGPFLCAGAVVALFHAPPFT